MSYAELHCLSAFSFLRGASDPRTLVRQAHALGYSAIAITDEASLAGVVRAFEESRSTGLKLIIGSEFRLADGNTFVVLVPCADAYTELCALITESRRRSEKGEYSTSYSDIAKHIQHGLIVWCPVWDSMGATLAAPEPTAWLRERFAGRAWIAWERVLHPKDHERLLLLGSLSSSSNLPLVAAGDVHMHDQERGDLQQVLTCVRHGCTLATAGDRLFPNDERHLRSLARLERLYPKQLLDETLAIADRCTFELDQLRYEYPRELVPEGLTAIQHLKNLTEAGIRKRWPDGCPAHVRVLIDKEYRLIEELKYEYFFLTVEDIAKEASRLKILHQGRGSSANSSVCFALGITEVDPARQNMLFERFISRERAEPPDIDIDFEHERRELIIQYIYRKYSRERAALAATVISYQPKSAIRDVGKAMGMTLEQVDLLSKSLAWWDDLDALKASMLEMGFKADGRFVADFMRLVTAAIGLPRHLSQHVGGFVISQTPLWTLVPVENAAMSGRTIIQWDKDDLETMKLLKVDVLALGMLTAIRKACDLVAKFRGKSFAYGDIPAEDAATYAMISRGETVGVFQIESRAQQALVPKLKPRCFYDLVVQVAIVRPGPIQGGMVHPYLRRRQGLEPIEYPSEEVKVVLERTLGVTLFQEQTMQLCMVAAGFTPGEADQVRRAMAAWKRGSDLERFRSKLLTGMAERGYTPEFAENIYQQILGFAGYGFPESHAASFALLTYASCWLRCHEHAAFVAALLNSQPMGFYSPSSLVNDARRAGVIFRAVDVSHSDWDCTLEPGDSGEPEVRLGLRVISGLREDAARRIVVAREQQSWRSIDDVGRRAALDRGMLNRLAHAGAFRSLEANRNSARWAATGVERLPGFLAPVEIPDGEIELPTPSEGHETVSDFQSTGLTIGHHPLWFLRDRLSALRYISAAAVRKLADGRSVRVCGIVTHRQRPQTASGVMFASLEDETGTHNIVIWPQVQEEYRAAVLSAQLMVVHGRLQTDGEVFHVIAKKVDDLSHWLGDIRSPSRDFH